MDRLKLTIDRETEIGCKMLALMCSGLVLTPEVVKWEYPHADNSPTFPSTTPYIKLPDHEARYVSTFPPAEMARGTLEAVKANTRDRHSRQLEGHVHRQSKTRMKS